MALLAVGGYFAYENWPAISAWFGSLTSTASTAVAAAAGATYPNSPVPVSFSTMQTFVDSSGNQWQFSTQTGTWVIATPGAAQASPSAGTVVSTAVPPPAAAPAAPPAVVTAVPASPGTVVSTGPPAPVSLVRVAPQMETIQASAPVDTHIRNPIYGMPHYRGF